MRWVSEVLALLTIFIDSVLVLHPRHKLHYFKTAGWEDEWINTARDIVREEFDRTYAFMDFDGEAVSMNEVRKSPKFFIVVYLLLLCVTSPHHPPIYSTICRHYLLLCHQNSTMNLIGTSVPAPSKSRMSVSGGMRGEWHILAFIVWH